MGTILAPDDLSIEMYVAVHSPKKPGCVVRVHGAPGFEFQEAERPAPVDPGVPLQVLGISMPFVACSILEPGGTLAGPVILDLRRVSLMRLTPDFIAAIIAFELQTQPEQDPESIDCDSPDAISPTI